MEKGYYAVTLHHGPGLTDARATFPFGQWAEIGYWLDELGPGEGHTASITFHPLNPLLEGSIRCPGCGAVVAWEGEEPDDCLRCGRPFSCLVDESAGQAELHSVRHELHEIDGPDVARAERLAAELRGEIEGWNPSTKQED